MKLQIAMLKFTKFSEKYRIYYEDTDAGGVVYYANYLKFFERARTDFLRSEGINQVELAVQKNAAFVVRRCEIDYFSPAKLDDLIEVLVEIKSLEGASMLIEQEISREGKILSKALVKIVCVDAKTFRPKRIEAIFESKIS